MKLIISASLNEFEKQTQRGATVPVIAKQLDKKLEYFKGSMGRSINMYIFPSETLCIPNKGFCLRYKSHYKIRLEGETNDIQ